VLNGKLNTATSLLDRIKAEVGPLKEELALLKTAKEESDAEVSRLKKEVEDVKERMLRKLEAEKADIIAERTTCVRPCPPFDASKEKVVGGWVGGFGGGWWVGKREGGGGAYCCVYVP
jgi:hypothetical protein